jgi:hypothetical protein
MLLQPKSRFTKSRRFCFCVPFSGLESRFSYCSSAAFSPPTPSRTLPGLDSRIRYIRFPPIEILNARVRVRTDTVMCMSGGVSRRQAYVTYVDHLDAEHDRRTSRTRNLHRRRYVMRGLCCGSPGAGRVKCVACGRRTRPGRIVNNRHRTSTTWRYVTSRRYQ